MQLGSIVQRIECMIIEQMFAIIAFTSCKSVRSQ